MTTSEKEEFDKALELLWSVSEAGKNYDRVGAICVFEGNDMIYADQLMELVEKVNVGVVYTNPQQALSAAIMTAFATRISIILRNTHCSMIRMFIS